MTTLARFNPFRAPTRFETTATFDDLFRNLGLGQWANQPEFMSDMRVDITEDDDSYYIDAEIPGVDKDDIDVSVEGNRVAINAETKREKEKRTRRSSWSNARGARPIAPLRSRATSTAVARKHATTRACSRSRFPRRRTETPAGSR